MRVCPVVRETGSAATELIAPANGVRGPLIPRARDHLRTETVGKNSSDRDFSTQTKSEYM